VQLSALGRCADFVPSLSCLFLQLSDVLNISKGGKDFKRNKAALYGLVFVPPLALSVANPDIFYSALDYAGAFGVSTLFLVLPPFMVWQQRYGDDRFPLATKPMG
jgi:tyrosine-specific transport protein